MTTPPFFTAGTLESNSKLRSEILTNSPKLVITDTNRKQGFRWNSIVNNAGYTETASEGPDTLDPLDEPLNNFPKAPADAQTTTVFNGLASVTASTYGSPVEYYVDERPAAAIDGNTNTAWIVAEVPTGQWWQATFDKPRTMNSINLVQAQTPHPNDLISEVRLTFDSKHPVLVHLGPASLTTAGQTITFPPTDGEELSHNHPWRDGSQSQAAWAISEHRRARRGAHSRCDCRRDGVDASRLASFRRHVVH